ncbi:MAG: hypothetical protein A2V83_08945 [Nitrospirae bacterium RBG_16_64_22]|nr:MAG: hypothetical protein A2V83_08945 [Nitrospirae bacterium RBG_16_64_22]
MTSAFPPVESVSRKPAACARCQALVPSPAVYCDMCGARMAAQGGMSDTHGEVGGEEDIFGRAVATLVSAVEPTGEEAALPGEEDASLEAPSAPDDAVRITVAQPRGVREDDAEQHSDEPGLEMYARAQALFLLTPEGRLDERTSILKEALTAGLIPVHAGQARILIGLGESRQGQMEEARKAIEEGISALSTEDPALMNRNLILDAHMELARLYESAGEFGSALNQWEKAFRLKGPHADIHLGRAGVYKKMNRPDMVKVELDRATALMGINWAAEDEKKRHET